MIGLGLACCGFTYACVGVGKRAKHIDLICICIWAVQRFAFPVGGALAARAPFDELHKVSSATCKHLVEQRTGAAAAWAW